MIEDSFWLPSSEDLHLYLCTLCVRVLTKQTHCALLSAQLATLKELSKRLKKRLGREEAGGIKARLKPLLLRRDKIKELAVKRREELELHKMFCIFKQDVEEVRDVSTFKQSEAFFCGLGQSCKWWTGDRPRSGCLRGCRRWLRTTGPTSATCRPRWSSCRGTRCLRPRSWLMARSSPPCCR